MTSSQPADTVARICHDVMAGRIVVGDLVGRAVERHLRDLMDGPARGLMFDVAAAERALRWFPSMLTITGGVKANQPFDLLWYQAFLTGQLFGWKRADTGIWRFRSVWVETGKGQGKSPWMAGLGLYGLRFAGVPRAEIYSAAATKDQAKVIFRDAVAMVRAQVPENDETLEEFCGIRPRGTGDETWKLEYDGSADGLGVCTFAPVASSDTQSGPKPLLVLVDEVHELKSADVIETWEQAITKVPGNSCLVMGTNTAAADQVVGTEYSDYYEDVVLGARDDDTSLVFIARTDKDDKPFEDPSCWAKSLPALGVTFERSNIQAQVQKAQGLPSKELAVKRLYFGVRVGAADCWVEWGLWESALGDFDESEFRDWECWLSLDQSNRIDFTALGKTWIRPKDGRRFVKVRYFTPSDTLAQRADEDKAPYVAWAREGLIEAVPGPTIPKAHVARAVKEEMARNRIVGMAFDPAQIQDFEEAATDVGLDVWRYEGPDKPGGSGLKMVRHGQGPRGFDSPSSLWMPRSVRETEEAIVNTSVTIHRSPVTNLCSANLKLADDGLGNRTPAKRRSRGRIDGMLTVIMGMGAAGGMVSKATQKSWWEED